MIALAFGALMSMALAALLIWFVLPRRCSSFTATLFSLQALYIAFLSGQGFDWPCSPSPPRVRMPGTFRPRSPAPPPACSCARSRTCGAFRRAFTGVRLARDRVRAARVRKSRPPVRPGRPGRGDRQPDLRRLRDLHAGGRLPRLAPRQPCGRLVPDRLGPARGVHDRHRLRLLFTGRCAEPLLYYGLPLSMVAAAILVALGVADRLREQRLALTDAERRAQTDPLTGVLNRRSLLERLDAACPARADARPADRAAVHRPRPLQAHQRHPRPPPATLACARSSRRSRRSCATRT